MTKILTKEDFLRAIENNFNKLSVFKFSASWCQPCKLLGSIIEDISPIEGVEFFDIDVDEAEETLIEDFSIKSIPAVFFYKNKLQIDRFNGMIGRENLINKIEENINR